MCSGCRSSSRLRSVWVATSYDNTAKDLIKTYKYDRARVGSVTIAHELHDILPYISSDCLITFVPTATTRFRQRGYDHAERIAKELAKLRGLQCLRLVTRLSQVRQVGANKAQRAQQLSKAFAVTKPKVVRHRSVLVIDDVTTTGSTLEAVARVLREAGARHVDAGVFAQKV